MREKEDGEREPWAEKEGEKEEQKEVDGGGPAKVLIFLITPISIDLFPWGYGRISNDQ